MCSISNVGYSLQLHTTPHDAIGTVVGGAEGAMVAGQVLWLMAVAVEAASYDCVILF